ncbi:MAG: hypothetical protein ACXWMI_05730 [Syntrophales bacterium]
MEQPLVITNNTSTTWTDFHLSVSLAGLGDPVFFEYPGTTFPDAYVGPGAAVFTGPYGGTPAAPFFATGPVDITGISIASGDT